MVGAKFCEKLVSSGYTSKHSVTVFGEEPRPAYDRVRLSSYVLNREPSRLELLPAEWYEENGIELKTGTRISSLNPGEKTVTDDKGATYPFDSLVFATGSYAFVPPFPGHDLDGVHVYRTIEDLATICDVAKKARSAAVIGGGLLGLEAAQALQYLEVENIHIIELARFLMPQQLDPSASEILLNEIKKQGFELHLETKTESIEKTNDGLKIHLDGSDDIQVDLLIVAAGIRPQSSLAKEAGIPLGGRGGIKVNNSLETEIPDIYAIGECAEHGNRIYGLAAPGYQMADTLAKILSGKKKEKFTGADTSTRLKMMGVDVVTLGEPLQPGETSTYQSETEYRHLSFDAKLRLKGALVVGSWPEVGQVQTAILQKQKLKKSQREHFESTGQIWSDGSECSVTTWADKAIVCNCMQVTKGTLCKLIEEGNRDLEGLSSKTGAGSVCGSCKPLVAELAGEVIPASEAATPKSRLLMWFSGAAILLALLVIFAPPLTIPGSVEDPWYKLDSLWRDFVSKQVTGYTLLGLSLIGLVMSLRKRFSWFTFGNFINWRAFHAAFGTASLIGLFAHTGFKFGDNLNFWLMFVFVALNILGAFAGIIASLEVRGTGKAAVYARRIRPSLTWAHVILFWPFPVLLCFHILSVYLY